MDNIQQVPVMATNKAGKSRIFMRNRVCHIEPSNAGDGCTVWMIDGKEMWCQGFTMEDFATALNDLTAALQVPE